MGAAIALLHPWFSIHAIAAYIPPADASAPSSGGTNTVRGGGCTGISAATLTPLAPQDHIGHTASTQPTLAWFTPETEPYTMEFRIVEYAADQQFLPIYETEFLSTDHTSSNGIGQFQLHNTDITLSPGKSYRWQVVMVCNPSSPSESLLAEADLVVAPVNLPPQPNPTAPIAERVDTYAMAGLWYDALAEALSIESPDAQRTQLQLLDTLVTLDQVAHSSTASDGDRPTIDSEDEMTHGDRLQQVIDILSLP